MTRPSLVTLRGVAHSFIKLDKVVIYERGELKKKTGLKLNVQKTKIMASSPITSWQIDGETVEIVTDFIWGAPKSLQIVIAAMKLKDTCSLEEKLWPT